MDVNRAPRERLLRVPGLGRKTIERILAARRFRAVRADDLARLRVSLPKVLPFLITADHRPRPALLDAPDLRRRLLSETRFTAVAKPSQLALF